MQSSEKSYASASLDAIEGYESGAYAFPFLKPVPKTVKGYRKVIKKPMDISTIRRKLKRNKYDSPASFRADVVLMFKNAITFNAQDKDVEGLTVYRAAKVLLDKFLTKWYQEAGGNGAADGNSDKVKVKTKKKMKLKVRLASKKRKSSSTSDAKSAPAKKPKLIKREWVQCEDCGKWRLLASGMTPSELPDVWRCPMNTWSNCNACDVAQESDDAIPAPRVEKVLKKVPKAVPKKELPSAPKAAVVPPKPKGVVINREWVQCEDCSKWRLLASGMTPSELPDVWRCSMNTWSNCNACDVAQESDDAIPVQAVPIKAKKKSHIIKRKIKVKRPAIAVKTSPTASASRPLKVDTPTPFKASTMTSTSTTTPAVRKQEYVACDMCNKWRMLPPHITASSLPDKWTCSMNSWDKTQAFCSAPVPSDAQSQSQQKKRRPSRSFRRLK